MNAAKTIEAASKLALKRDSAIGIKQLNKGHCRVYSDKNFFQLVEEISFSGKRRLKCVK
jgi:hypothetical protein